MFNHQPPEYKCPLCALIAGEESQHNSLTDIVLQNEFLTASIAPKWWDGHDGHVLIFPNQHHENIYDLPDEIAGAIYKAAKKISIAIRSTYGCDGTSNRQHNEPAGNQDLWHLHMHVYPRYEGDRLYQDHDKTRWVSAEERKVYADKLRAYFSQR